MSDLSSVCDLLPPLTAIIGGGGKTTLLLRLADMLAERGQRVLVTTTTHLAWPPPEGLRFCTPSSPEELAALTLPGSPLLAGSPCGGGRMVGVPFPLCRVRGFDYILCEADGSNRMPLKVHRQGEPVVPTGTGLVIQVAGLSALGQPVEQVVHRHGLLPAAEGTVTTDLVAEVLLRGWTHTGFGGERLTLLNQADTEALQTAGAEIAARMERQGYATTVTALRRSMV